MPNTAELFDTENIKSKIKSHHLQQQNERVRAILSREQQAAEEKISRLRALRREKTRMDARNNSNAGSIK